MKKTNRILPSTAKDPYEKPFPTWVLSAAAITMPSAGIPRAQLSTTNLVSWILGAMP
jgi:hypothetical protein